jgi:NTP pyrophosphatase (non-canonical NTP hydrolase)
MKEFITNVQNWASERGIYDYSTGTAQLLKAISEMGELADAHAKMDILEMKDAVGDILVCLVNYCKLEGLDLTQCCESAWNEIKDRKGHMVEGGVFIKE